MFIYNGTFSWDGWGGAIRLAAGKCHLWLFDLRHLPRRPKGMIFMQPLVGVVKEIDPDNPVSLRSVTSHIATQVTRRFNIEPRRLLWLEYLPPRSYRGPNPRTVPARLDLVELKWVGDKAMHPSWRPLEEPLQSLIQDHLESNASGLP